MSNDYDPEKALERLLSSLQIEEVSDGMDDKDLRNVLGLMGDVHEEKFGQSDTSDNGLSLEELAHQYNSVRKELDRRGVDYESYGPLNKLTTDDLEIDDVDEPDEEDEESGESEEGGEKRMELERKGDGISLNKEVDVFYTGGGSLWLEGVDGEKTAWLKAGSSKSSGAMPVEPDVIIEDDYEGNGLTVEKKDDSYVLDYGGVKLAHKVSEELDTEASLATVVVGEDDSVKEPSGDFHTVFYLPGKDAEVDPDKLDEGQETAAPSEWVCSLGVIDV